MQEIQNECNKANSFKFQATEEQAKDHMEKLYMKYMQTILVS